MSGQWNGLEYGREARTMTTKTLETIDRLMSLRARSQMLSMKEDDYLLRIQRIIILRGEIDAEIDHIEASK